MTLPETAGGGQALTTPAPDRDAYEAEFAWIPVSITLVPARAGDRRRLVVGTLAAARPRGMGGNPLAEALEAALDESLDDLRAEPDPRRAVIAAYARLEQVLASHGLPRITAEAPLEYLGACSLNFRSARPRP